MVCGVAGPLQFFRRFFGRQTAAVAAASVALGSVSPPVGEKGITGTGNYAGNLFVEPNKELRNAEGYGRAGTTQRGFWEEARHTDESVSTAVAFVVAPIRDAKAVIEEPDPEINPDGKKQAEFLRWVIDNVEPGWPEFLQQMAAGQLVSGFSMAEEVWSAVSHPSLPGGQGYAITKLAERLPSSLAENAWDVDESTGELRGVQQRGPLGTTWVQAVIPSSKLQLYSWNRSGDNFQGYSAFRSVFYLIKIRAQLARLIAVGQVREAAGIPVVTSEKDAADLTPKDLQDLQKFMANLVGHENANIILPRGWKMDWVFAPTASRSNVVETYNHLGLLILRVLGAQQVVLGTGATGSRSVGEVHSAHARIIFNGVFANIENVLNGVRGRAYTGFVRKLIDANFGPQLAYPKLKLQAQLPELPPQELFAALKAAVESGAIKIRPGDENNFRERLGMEPLEDEDEQAEKEPTAVDPGSAGPHTPGAAGSTPATAIPAKEPEQTAAGVSMPGAPAVAGAVTEKAQDTAYNGAQITGFFEGLKIAASKELPPKTMKKALMLAFRLSKEDADELIDPLTNGTFTPPPPPPAPPSPFDPPGGKPPALAEVQAPAQKPEPTTVKASAVGAFVPRRALRASELKLDLEGISNLFDRARTEYSDGVRPLVAEALMRALPEVKIAMEDGDATDVGELVQLDLSRVEQFTAEFLNRLRSEGYRHVSREKRYGQPLRAAAEEDDRDQPSPDVSEEAHRDAETALVPLRKHVVRQMRNRLSSALEKEAIDVLRTGGEPEEVITRALERQATTGAFKTDAGLVTAKAFSLGREEFAQEYANQVESVELSAVLDDGTCVECERLDGEEFDFGSPEDIRFTPPLSNICRGADNCRCLKIINFARAA